ncbi:MAG: hypothetical protein QM803_11015 [Rhodocyclaceae bacterium]
MACPLPVAFYVDDEFAQRHLQPATAAAVDSQQPVERGVHHGGGRR